MATAAALSFEFTGFGRTVSIPDDDVARLMYYLNCVTASLGMDILQDDLLDYMNYRRLSTPRIALVFKTAVELEPKIFIDKVLFRDDSGEVVPTGSSNKFVEITAACDVVSIQRDFVIGGQVKDVTKVMFFRSSWLKTYYSDPIERIANIILGTKHCSHCEGTPGMCACSTCPRGSMSECKPLFESFLDVLLTGTSSTSNIRPISPAPPPPPPRPVQHQANCDGCQWQLFTGPRYKCNNCYDFDLCENCYRLDKHVETGHHFRKYETPDSSPVYLAARVPYRAPPPPPPPPYQEATRAPPMPTPIIPTRAPAPPPRSPPAPPAPPAPQRFVAPLDRKTPLSSSSNANPAASKFFYQSMSIAELKAFLNERDVDGGDILDKETLCKRVWETHCDCMSMSELTTFLTSSNISTAGCRSVNDRREKAKAAFEPPVRPVPGPTDRGSGGWRKDDLVVLTGLSKADMNGKAGKIQLVDSEARKVTVFVDDLGRAFKVKYENVQPYVEDLGGDNDVEELE